MKWFLKILIPLVILGGAAYQFRDRLIFLAAPCSQPIAYTLGTFSTEFKISEKYFLSALSDAEAIWEKPAEKDLFNYSPDDNSYSVLKINLIYDFRQEATSTLAKLGIKVDETRGSYDSLKAKFNALKVKYEAEKNSFEARVAGFNQAKEVYEEKVKYWNSRGGASQKEYAEMQAMRLALEKEAKALQELQVGLNNRAEELNAMIVVLNRLAGALNLSVEEYNTVNDARGESFEEGVYYSEGLTQKIDIYEFSSREKLVRVLAHELGHALGLGHVADSKAIMYELNQNNSLALTTADREALEAKCGKQDNK